MLYTVSILFLVAVMGGVTAIVKHFKGKRVSPVFGFAHGAIGLVGLLFLGITVFTVAVDPLVKTAFWLFALAACGGLTQAVLRLRDTAVPKAVYVLHGTIAAVAFVLLLIGAWL